jgi:hypothetical protein
MSTTGHEIVHSSDGERPVAELPTTLAEDYPHLVDTRPTNRNKWIAGGVAASLLAAGGIITAVKAMGGESTPTNHKTTPVAASTRTPGAGQTSAPSVTEAPTPSPTVSPTTTEPAPSATSKPSPTTEASIGPDGEHVSQTNEIIPTDALRKMAEANNGFTAELLANNPDAVEFSSKSHVDWLNGSGVISKKNIAAYFANLEKLSAKDGFLDTVGSYSDVSAETYPQLLKVDSAVPVALTSNYTTLTLHRVAGSKQFGPAYYDLLSLNPKVNKQSKEYVAEQFKAGNTQLDGNTYAADVSKVLNTYDVALGATEEVTVIETYEKFNSTATGPVERLLWTALFDVSPKISGDTTDAVMGVNADVLDITPGS